MEEDVRKIELAIIKAEYYNLDITTDIIEIKTLKNVLNELERLKKENEELKEHMKNREHNYTVAIREQIENSIPKEKIENEIKELKQEINKNDKMINEYRSTLKENELEKIAKIDKARFDNVVYYNEINILKELLEEEK